MCDCVRVCVGRLAVLLFSNTTYNTVCSVLSTRIIVLARENVKGRGGTADAVERKLEISPKYQGGGWQLKRQSQSH